MGFNVYGLQKQAQISRIEVCFLESLRMLGKITHPGKKKNLEKNGIKRKFLLAYFLQL
jgi:hypothetical protein